MGCSLAARIAGHSSPHTGPHTHGTLTPPDDSLAGLDKQTSLVFVSSVPGVGMPKAGEPIVGHPDKANFKIMAVRPLPRPPSPWCPHGQKTIKFHGLL